MASDEAEVRAAAERFYKAIDDIISDTSNGLKAMSESWHHTPRVTSGHPTQGEWVKGWDVIWETWQVLASLAKPGCGHSSIRDLNVYVYGDVAYTTCIFTAAPAFGGGSMGCTDIFTKVDGAWKLVHHHADKAPSLDVAMERIAEEKF